MHEVDVEFSEALDVDRCLELGQFGVQLRFLRTPIEAMLPVFCETLNIIAWCAVRPIVGEVDHVGEVGHG